LISPKNKHSYVTYDQPNLRALGDYINILGEEFENTFLKLGDGDNWLDIGAGFGMAVIHGIVEKQRGNVAINGTTINLQDNWSHVFSNIKDGVEDKKNDLIIGTLSSIFREPKDYFYEQGEKIALNKVKESLVSLRGFKFVASEALEYLEGANRHARLITDLYGAFTYSIDKVALIEAYYRALNRNGIAIIYDRRIKKWPRSPYGSHAKVVNGDMTMPLQDYFRALNSPAIECGDGKIIIRKIEKLDELDFGLCLTDLDQVEFWGPGQVPTNMIYKLKPS
jgi:hypothetical protein